MVHGVHGSYVHSVKLWNSVNITFKKRTNSYIKKMYNDKTLNKHTIMMESNLGNLSRKLVTWISLAREYDFKKNYYLLFFASVILC